jgi:hypothetical protein
MMYILVLNFLWFLICLTNGAIVLKFIMQIQKQPIRAIIKKRKKWLCLSHPISTPQVCTIPPLDETDPSSRFQHPQLCQLLPTRPKVQCSPAPQCPPLVSFTHLLGAPPRSSPSQTSVGLKHKLHHFDSSTTVAF